MGYEKYVLDKILKVQIFDENGNVIAECKGQEGLSVSYDNYEEEND
jgi:hypothetical protein